MSNIKFDGTKLQEIIDDIDKELKNLTDAYKEIETKMSKIDGTDELWKSTSQKTTYDYYKDLQQNFEKSVENLNNCKEFLVSTKENYSNSIATNDKDVEDNKEDLDTDTN